MIALIRKQSHDLLAFLRFKARTHGGKKNLIFLARESLISYIPARDGKLLTFFYSVGPVDKMFL
jgi:hypothetical protein